MRLIIPLVTICLSIVAVLILLNCIESVKHKRSTLEKDLSKKQKKSNKEKNEIVNSETTEEQEAEASNCESCDDFPNVKKNALIYSLIMSAVLIGISIWFSFTDIDLFYSIKLMALLSIMWPITFTDIKWYTIPNKFILYGIGCRLLLLPFEFLICGFEYMKVQIFSEIIASAIIVIPCLIFYFVSKNSIGAGDIKLFFLMGLFLGTENIWNALFISLFISFLVSLFFLITKKKGRKDVIPMGPSIAIGTFLSIIMLGI